VKLSEPILAWGIFYDEFTIRLLRSKVVNLKKLLHDCGTFINMYLRCSLDKVVTSVLHALPYRQNAVTSRSLSLFVPYGPRLFPTKSRLLSYNAYYEVYGLFLELISSIKE
jgi:hypothetical protein